MAHLIALYPENQIFACYDACPCKSPPRSLSSAYPQQQLEDSEWVERTLSTLCPPREWNEALPSSTWAAPRAADDKTLLTYSRAGRAGATENIFAIDGNTRERRESRRCCCSPWCRKFNYYLRCHQRAGWLSERSCARGGLKPASAGRSPLRSALH